jgi:hypothetical protein
VISVPAGFVFYGSSPGLLNDVALGRDVCVIFAMFQVLSYAQRKSARYSAFPHATSSSLGLGFRILIAL